MTKYSATQLGRYRALLSDVLPYEVPPTFSNRSFFRFVKLFKTDQAITGTEPEEWKAPSTAHAELMRILCPTDSEWTIPFTFGISRGHANGSERTLAIPHPVAQMQAARFYDSYRNQLLYFTSKSNFSIRYPSRVARYTMGIESSPRRGDLPISTVGPEDRTSADNILRSYFRYEKYSNIYKFYDSPEFVSLESKFPILLRLDIAQCFESIYTHSIPWAVLGKNGAKVDRGRHHFGNKLDRLMQRLNFDETSGLPVGPELSRICAEIILQEIDRLVESDLRSQGLVNRQDYDIARYVDDYFVYAESEAQAIQIRQIIAKRLREFNLNLNQAKEALQETPHLSTMSMTKAAIKDAFELSFPTSLDQLLVASQQEKPFRATRVIFEYKRAISSGGSSHREVINFALAVLEKKSDQQFANLIRMNPPLTQQKIQDLLVANVEITTFLLGRSHLVAPTIKTCRIIAKVLQFAESNLQDRSRIDVVKDVIHANILQLLTSGPAKGSSNVERLYLLTLLRTLGDSWLLPEKTLRNTFLKANAVNDAQVHSSDLNYFSIVSLLHYLQSRKRYAELRKQIVRLSIQRVGALPVASAERALLAVDLLACPYVSAEEKHELLDSVHASKSPAVRRILLTGLFSFTTWRRFNLQQQLEYKRNLAAY